MLEVDQTVLLVRQIFGSRLDYAGSRVDHADSRSDYPGSKSVGANCGSDDIGRKLVIASSNIIGTTYSLQNQRVKTHIA